MLEKLKNFHKGHPRQFKTGGKVALALLLIFVAGVIFSEVFLDKFIKKRIIKSVHESSQGLYTLEIGDLDTHIWTGNVEMEDLFLHQDTSILEGLQKKYPEENFGPIFIKSQSAEINHIRWLNYLFSKNLKVGVIKLESPEMVATGSAAQENIRSANKSFLELLPGIVAGFAGSLKIEGIHASNGKIRYDIQTPEGIFSQKAQDISIALDDILIDTIPRKQLLYSEDISFSLSNYILTTPRNEHNLRIGKIKGELSDSILLFQNIQFLQKDLKNPQKVLSKVEMKSLEGTGVTFRSFFYDKQIKINKIVSESPKVEGTIELQEKDKSQNKDEKFLVPSFLSDILQSFSINLISVRNGSVNNTILTSDGRITQKANSIFLDIAQISGQTLDTIQLKAPDDVSLSLKNYEIKMPDPNFDVSVKSFNASTITGKMRADQIKLSFSEVSTNEKVVSTIQATAITGDGFNFRKAIKEKNVILNQLVISSPQITIKETSLKERKQDKKFSGFLPESLPEAISSYIKTLNVNALHLNNGNIHYFVQQAGKLETHKVNDLNVQIKNINSKATDNKLDYKNIEARVGSYFFNTGKQRFTLTSGATYFSSEKNEAVIENIKIEQDHPPGKEEDHYTATIPVVRAFGFNAKEAASKGRVISKEVVVENLKLNILLHEGKSDKPDIALKMPNEIFRSLDFYLNLNTVRLNNALIAYNDATGERPILFDFENTKATIKNLTNDPKIMSRNNPAILQGHTFIMGKGKLDLTIKIPLLTENINGEYKGTFSGMEGNHFNNAFVSAGFNIQSGTIQPSNFEASIKEGTISGNLVFVYKNLKIKILSDDGTKSRLKSIIGNFTTKNSNPKDKEDAPEIVEISANRTPKDSFFSFLWSPIEQGIIKTVTKDRVYNKLQKLE